MKFVSIRELRSGSARLRKMLAGEEIVLTANGKPWALLNPVSEETLEQELEALRRARALIALDRAQRVSWQRGGPRPSDAEIEREIKAVRRAAR